MQPVGISRDSPWTHIAWTQALDLNFGLLSDFNGEAVRAFGIGFEFRGFRDVARQDDVPRRRAGRGQERLGVRHRRHPGHRRVAGGGEGLETGRLTCLNRSMDTPSTGSAAPTRGSNSLTLALLAGVVVVGAIFAFSGSAFVPNNWYIVFKTVHVLFAVVWVGGGVSIMILALRPQTAHDPNEIVTVARQAAFVGEKVFAPAGLVTFLMGIAMMLNTSWGWGHFWIVAGLVGYASTFIVGVAILSPMAKKIDAFGGAQRPRRSGGARR